MANNSAVGLTKAAERLRQQRDTFDQKKKHDSRWFWLKLIMGYSAVILMLAILVISSVIIFNYQDYTDKIINWAAPALFVDILGLIFTVWKVVLAPNNSTKLEPEIK